MTGIALALVFVPGVPAGRPLALVFVPGVPAGRAAMAGSGFALIACLIFAAGQPFLACYLWRVSIVVLVLLRVSVLSR